MREITDHKVTKFNDAHVRVMALDRTGANYGVTLDAADPSRNLYVRFQQGAVEDAGVNGVTEESLIALLTDRLAQLPQTKHVTDAAAQLRKALGSLQKRAKLLGEAVE